MGHKLKLKLKNGNEILSPVIEPNNPKYDRDHKSIPGTIRKIGRSMVRQLDNVVSYECVSVGEV